jgi:hypothetical protein
MIDRSRSLRQGNDRVDIEISADRLARHTGRIRFIGLEAMQREAIFVRIDGDGADAEFMGGAKDADGDFTAIGDEQFLKWTSRHRDRHRRLRGRFALSYGRLRSLDCSLMRKF